MGALAGFARVGQGREIESVASAFASSLGFLTAPFGDNAALCLLAWWHDRAGGVCCLVEIASSEVETMRPSSKTTLNANSY